MVVENPTQISGGVIPPIITGINPQITFPMTIGSLTTAISENNNLQNNTNNVYFESMRNSNVSSGILMNSNNSSVSDSDVFCQNPSNSNVSSINSLSEYSQSHGNVFGSSNLQPGLFLPNRKRKSFNK